MNGNITLAVLVSCIALSACGRREASVRHYTEIGGEPLEPQQAAAAGAQPGMNPMMAAMLKMASDGPNLDWKLPEGWTEKPGGGPILKAFDAAGAECAIIAFPPMMAAAPVEQKMGIWLSQMNVRPPSDEELAAFAAKPTKVDMAGGYTGDMYDFTDLTGKDAKSSMISVMFSVDGKSLAVRLKGAPGDLATRKEAFIGFVESLRKKSP